MASFPGLGDITHACTCMELLAAQIVHIITKSNLKSNIIAPYLLATTCFKYSCNRMTRAVTCFTSIHVSNQMLKYLYGYTKMNIHKCNGMKLFCFCRIKMKLHKVSALYKHVSNRCILYVNVSDIRFLTIFF